MIFFLNNILSLISYSSKRRKQSIYSHVKYTKIYKKWIYTEIISKNIFQTNVMNDVSTFYLDGGFCPTHAKK